VWFSSDYVYSNDDSALKVTEDLDDKVFNLQEGTLRNTLGTVLSRFVQYTHNQVSDQQLTRQKEEVPEDNGTFLDTVKGTEAARKYICLIDNTDNTTVIMQQS
jgi:hypothetical protein